MSTTAGSSKSFVSRDEDDVTHCKDDAPNEREYELLVEGTYRLDSDYFELESRWVVFAAGRYGMRSGEIAHMSRDWIDDSENMIKIPRHYSCDKGKDGGICGYCRQSAIQMATHNDGLSVEEAESYMWSPKTEAGAREIPLNASTRARIAMSRYFEEYPEFMASTQAVNRRVNRAAENAPEIHPDDVYPHALRSACASRLVARGLDVVALKQLMGWASFSTAKVYLAESGARTEKALQQIV